MAKQFYESWKRIYRLFASSTNSFEVGLMTIDMSNLLLDRKGAGTQ